MKPPVGRRRGQGGEIGLGDNVARPLEGARGGEECSGYLTRVLLFFTTLDTGPGRPLSPELNDTNKVYTP